jgi:Fe-S-cluster containining protein
LTSPPGAAPANQVHLHDFQAFQCTGCGRCCKPWRVNIDPHQFLEISQTLAYNSRTREGYVPLLNCGEGLAKMGDRGDDVCHFLDEKALCSLHSEMGAAGKPLGCQLYPYQLVDTPGGTYVHLSFGCPPVVAGLDRDAQANRLELELALVNRKSKPFPELVRLSEHQSISWASYLQLEERILSAYALDDPLGSILKIVLCICRARTLGAGGEGQPWPPLALGLEDTEFPRELLAKYLGLVVGSLENEQDEATRNLFISFVQDGLLVTSGQFGMELPPMSLLPSTQGWVLQTYQRYFRNAVLGKSLLKTTVLSRLLATACAITLVGFYAEAFRLARGEDQVNLQSLTDAFEIVEVRVATHTKLTEPFFSDLERTFEKIAKLPIDELS